MSQSPTGAPTGLDLFRAELDPTIVEQIAQWQTDPELSKLSVGLQAIADREKFLDNYAEAIIARYLLDRDCLLRVEVMTPSGRSCDFEVVIDGHRFYLHVKRLNTDRAVQKRLSVSSRLRYLERITRPYVVGVRFNDGLSDTQMQHYVTTAAEFIKRARVGDELVIRDVEDAEIGGCKIIAPWQGSRVILAIGLPTGFIDEAPRMRRLLRKAYWQFMPGETNVILISSSHAEDVDDFGNALLGSHIERWDAPPARGRRVAYGRDADGFWHQNRSPESSAAGWFHFWPQVESPQCRLWIREPSTLDPSMREALADLFGG